MKEWTKGEIEDRGRIERTWDLLDPEITARLPHAFQLYLSLLEWVKRRRNT